MHALIFDLDGTLTQTNSVDTECFVEAIQAVLNLPTVDTNWDSYSCVTDQGIIEEMSVRQRGSEITSSEVDEVEAHFVSLLQKQPDSSFSELPGAGDFIKRLRGNNIPVAIATGCWRSSAHFKLQQAGLDFSGIPVATSSDALSRENIMLFARDALLDQHKPDSIKQATYFGDATWDVRACSQLCWDFVGIGARIDTLRESGVRHTFPDFTADDRILAALGIRVAEEGNDASSGDKIQRPAVA